MTRIFTKTTRTGVFRKHISRVRVALTAGGVTIHRGGSQGLRIPTSTPSTLGDQFARELLADGFREAPRGPAPHRNDSCPECGAHEGSGDIAVHGVTAAHHTQCGTPESPFAALRPVGGAR